MDSSSSRAPVCGNCLSFDPAKLERYGYCRAAPTPEERSRFLHYTQPCWINGGKGFQPLPLTPTPLPEGEGKKAGDE
ncbi:hypothetical protein AGMMS50256_25690 [Betaproteobacteria bacterium]|nr:hypothetical protein AGMMS50256_25690 [Betaproteobacteria bacterium]